MTIDTDALPPGPWADPDDPGTYLMPTPALPATADEAHWFLVEYIRPAARWVDESFVALGERLLFARERGHAALLGYPSFEAYLADPENLPAIGRREMYRAMAAARLLAAGVSRDEVVRMGVAKAALAARAILAAEGAERQSWVDAATSLTRSDLVAELRLSVGGTEMLPDPTWAAFRTVIRQLTDRLELDDPALILTEIIRVCQDERRLLEVGR